VTLLTNALAGLARGWSFTPLNGKVPVLRAWSSQPRSTETQVREWIAQGHNLGLRTGAASGILVIDQDTGGDVTPLNLPDTITVQTGGGGKHYYYQHVPGVRNSAGKLGDHIDVRGDGGQVVFPGSRHPVTKRLYEFLSDGDPGKIPPSLASLLNPPTDSWGRAALRAESSLVSASSEGTRHDTLIRSSYKIGQIVGGNGLNHPEAVAALFEAAISTGLPEPEVSRTISDGLAKGAENPRTPAETAPTHYPHTDHKDVLCPGTHITGDGEEILVSTDTFTVDVYRHLPDDAIYEMASITGEIRDDMFRPMRPDRARLIVDRHVRLKRWVMVGQGQGKAKLADLTYVPCNKDLGGIVIEGAHGNCRSLKFLTTYPVFVGEDFCISPSGWRDGVFNCSTLKIPHVENPQAILADLVTDFPFKDAASRDNFFGLLLTPLLRPALDGNAPMHLVMSAVERCGKTKLIEEILGGVVLGMPTPATQLPKDIDSLGKQILSFLIGGRAVLHLDNLPNHIDSGALASMLTCSSWSDRVLGRSEIVTVPNNLTLVASGNNVSFSGELAKRTVPIELQPFDDKPEERTDYKHPQLRKYIRENRPRILGALVSMVEAWKAEGCPLSGNPFGGFESWAGVIGGILELHGYTEWRKNSHEFVVRADSLGEGLRAFVERWAAESADTPRAAGALLSYAEGLFPWIDERETERGRTTALGRLLKKHAGRPLNGWAWEQRRSRSGYSFVLKSLA